MPKPLKILDAQTVIKKTPKNTSQQKPRYWPCWRHSSCLPGSCYSPAKPDWTGLHGSRGRSRGSFARHVHWPCCRDRWSDSHARDSHARDSHARDDLGCHHLHLGKGWGFQGFGPKGHELAGKMMFLTFASGFWEFSHHLQTTQSALAKLTPCGWDDSWSSTSWEIPLCLCAPLFFQEIPHDHEGDPNWVAVFFSSLVHLQLF